MQNQCQFVCTVKVIIFWWNDQMMDIFVEKIW